MTRLKQAWLALCGKLEPEVLTESDSPPSGVLFGLDPPEGCHFEVSCFRGQSWHVWIRRDGNKTVVTTGCALCGYGGSDEDLIVAAAKEALKAYARQTSVTELEGCYPPKIAKGKRRNGE